MCEILNVIIQCALMQHHNDFLINLVCRWLALGSPSTCKSTYIFREGRFRHLAVCVHAYFIAAYSLVNHKDLEQIKSLLDHILADLSQSISDLYSKSFHAVIFCHWIPECYKLKGQINHLSLCATSILFEKSIITFWLFTMSPLIKQTC